MDKKNNNTGYLRNNHFVMVTLCPEKETPLTSYEDKNVIPLQHEAVPFFSLKFVIL